jgi:hypothetical protein
MFRCQILNTVGIIRVVFISSYVLFYTARIANGVFVFPQMWSKTALVHWRCIFSEKVLGIHDLNSCVQREL